MEAFDACVGESFVRLDFCLMVLLSEQSLLLVLLLFLLVFMYIFMCAACAFRLYIIGICFLFFFFWYFGSTVEVHVRCAQQNGLVFFFHSFCRNETGYKLSVRGRSNRFLSSYNTNVRVCE